MAVPHYGEAMFKVLRDVVEDEVLKMLEAGVPLPPEFTFRVDFFDKLFQLNVAGHLVWVNGHEELYSIPTVH